MPLQQNPFFLFDKDIRAVGQDFDNELRDLADRVMDTARKAELDIPSVIQMMIFVLVFRGSNLAQSKVIGEKKSKPLVSRVDFVTNAGTLWDATVHVNKLGPEHTHPHKRF